VVAQLVASQVAVSSTELPGGGFSNNWPFLSVSYTMYVLKSDWIRRELLTNFMALSPS
jgi:hypothetical protein